MGDEHERIQTGNSLQGLSLRKSLSHPYPTLVRQKCLEAMLTPIDDEESSKCQDSRFRKQSRAKAIDGTFLRQIEDCCPKIGTLYLLPIHTLYLHFSQISYIPMMFQMLQTRTHPHQLIRCCAIISLRRLPSLGIHTNSPTHPQL